MSAFYLLGLFAVWVALTVLIWKQWRNRRKRTEGKHGRIDALFAVVALVWLAASFWYSGGRKYYYDAEVERLCAIDGGIKVYETVRLPAEKFNQWGQPNFYNPTRGENALGANYIYRSESIYLRKGDPTLIRHHHEVIRQSDNQKLGESTSYGRGGGDLPGPWHSSSFGCPEERGVIPLLTEIFQR